MPNLSIKDVPEALAERLRERAARNHRSLQGELMAIVTQASGEADNGAPAAAPHAIAAQAGVGWGGRPIVRRGGSTLEQIAAEHRVRFPQPVGSGPSAAEIIRAERDAR